MRMRWGIAALAALMGSACSGISVNQDFNPAFEFSALRTWGWLDQAAGSSGTGSQLTDQRIRTAIEAGLQAKGFQKVESGESNFRVGYRVTTQDKVTYETVHDYWGTGWGYRGVYGPTMASSRTYAREYTMGTLLIGFFDVASHELVWLGSAEAQINRTSDPEKRQKLIQEAVDKILAQYPPKR